MIDPADPVRGNVAIPQGLDLAAQAFPFLPLFADQRLPFPIDVLEFGIDGPLHPLELAIGLAECIPTLAHRIGSDSRRHPSGGQERQPEAKQGLNVWDEFKRLHRFETIPR